VLHDCLISLSPFVGPMTAINRLYQIEFHDRGPTWLGIGLVILIKTAIAGLLLWLTTRTFDRCLGRVSESGFRARSLPASRHRSGKGDLFTSSSDFSIRISPVISPSEVRET
jgi:hypothetical protein